MGDVGFEKANFASLLEQLRSRPVGKVLYPRQEIMKKFVDRLNSERGKDFKPLQPGFVASKMYQSGLKSDWDLWWFWGYCNDASNFSKCWWGSLKYKVEEKVPTLDNNSHKKEYHVY